MSRITLAKINVAFLMAWMSTKESVIRIIYSQTAQLSV